MRRFAAFYTAWSVRSSGISISGKCQRWVSSSQQNSIADLSRSEESEKSSGDLRESDPRALLSDENDGEESMVSLKKGDVSGIPLWLQAAVSEDDQKKSLLDEVDALDGMGLSDKELQDLPPDIRKLIRARRGKVDKPKTKGNKDGKTSPPAAVEGEVIASRFWKSVSRKTEAQKAAVASQKAREDAVERDAIKGKHQIDALKSEWRRRIQNAQGVRKVQEVMANASVADLELDDINEAGKKKTEEKHNLGERFRRGLEEDDDNIGDSYFNEEDSLGLWSRMKKTSGHWIPLRPRMIVLPEALKLRLSRLFKHVDRHELRHRANELTDVLRNRTRQTPGTTFEPSNVVQPILYAQPHALAYCAVRYPGVFSCITRVLQELRFRFPQWSPQSMLDFGSGPGTAIWATEHVFQADLPNGSVSLNRVVAVEPSEGMQRCAKILLEGFPGVTYHHQLPPISGGAGEQRFDLVMASYVLSELPTHEARDELISGLWTRVRHGGMLVMVDAGTPVGYEILLRARDRLLASDATRTEVVAPCPHSHKCPLSADSFCHFSQRMQRIPIQRLTKKKSGAPITASFEDENFTYMILRKRSKETFRSHQIQTTVDSDVNSGKSARSLQVVEVDVPGKAEVSSAEDDPSSAGGAKSLVEDWDRLICSPQKRGGHVTLTSCGRDGHLHTHVVTRSMGKDMYKDARKATWGDAFRFPSSLTERILTNRHWPKTFRAEEKHEAS